MTADDAIAIVIALIASGAVGASIKSIWSVLTRRESKLAQLERKQMLLEDYVYQLRSHIDQRNPPPPPPWPNELTHGG